MNTLSKAEVLKNLNHQIDSMKVQIAQIKLMKLSNQMELMKFQLDHFGEDMPPIKAEAESPEITREKFRINSRRAELEAEKQGMYKILDAQIETLREGKQPEILTRGERAAKMKGLEISRMAVGNNLNIAADFLGKPDESFHISLFRGKAKQIFEDAIKTSEQREKEIWESSEENKQIADFNLIMERQKSR